MALSVLHIMSISVCTSLRVWRLMILIFLDPVVLRYGCYIPENCHPLLVHPCRKLSLRRSMQAPSWLSPSQLQHLSCLTFLRHLAIHSFKPGPMQGLQSRSSPRCMLSDASLAVLSRLRGVRELWLEGLHLQSLASLEHFTSMQVGSKDGMNSS